MAAIGLVLLFQPDSKCIGLYLQHVEMFLKMKVAMLPSVIGGNLYEPLSSILAPTKPSSKKFEDMVEVLCEHFKPQPVIITE